jgi:hypothetical protein
MSKDKENRGNLFVIHKEEDFSKEEENEELTPKVAAYRLCRSIQNIYLEIASQQNDMGSNTHEELQKSFALREYGEMYMLRNMDSDLVLEIYRHVQDEDDWNEVIFPMNWGYITFQKDPKVSFLMFINAVMQSIIEEDRTRDEQE